jgi:hypothetical protein
MSDYYELLEQNYEQNYDWDCDPEAPIVQALIKAIAAQKAKQQWKGPSWNDGHQVRPLLD